MTHKTMSQPWRRPAQPAPHVCTPSGGAIGLPGRGLIKPGHACDEVVDGSGRQVQAVWGQTVPQPVKSFLNPPDERLGRMLADIEGGEHLIDYPDRSPQFPARRREHQDVVHEADVAPPRASASSNSPRKNAARTGLSGLPSGRPRRCASTSRHAPPPAAGIGRSGSAPPGRGRAAPDAGMGRTAPASHPQRVEGLFEQFVRCKGV